MLIFSDEFALGQSRRAIVEAIDERLLSLSGEGTPAGSAAAPQVRELLAARAYLTRSQLAFMRDGVMIATTGLLINEGARLLGITSGPPPFDDFNRAFGVVVAALLVGCGAAFVPYWKAHSRCVAIARALNARSEQAADVRASL